MSNLLLSATGIFFFLGTVMHSDVPEIFLFFIFCTRLMSPLQSSVT